MNVVQTVGALAALSTFVLPVILGLVTFYGKMGVSGKWQLLSSLLTGLVLGGGLGFLQLGMIPSAEVISSSMVYGLVLGLTASGTYEAVKEASVKGTLLAEERSGTLTDVE